MFRKRKQPTPHFKLPPPFNPVTGGNAPLQMEGVFPYTAMMQVAEADTHDDYLVCRGFDVRIHKFSESIAVAKPMWCRQTGVYTVGQIFPAILPLQTGNPSPSDVLWRVGQNPGVSATTQGHPADLDEEVEALTDDSDVYIAYQIIDEGRPIRGGCLAEDHPGRGTVFGIWLASWNSSTHSWTYDSSGDNSNPAIDWRYGVPYPDQGSTGLFTPRASDTYGIIWECVSLDCDVPTTYSCTSGSLPT